MIPLHPHNLPLITRARLGAPPRNRRRRDRHTLALIVLPVAALALAALVAAGYLMR